MVMVETRYHSYHNRNPASNLGRDGLCFWETSFSQTGPVVSEKAWGNPAVPKAGLADLLGSLSAIATGSKLSGTWKNGRLFRYSLRYLRTG